MRNLVIGIFLLLVHISAGEAKSKANDFITLELDFGWSATQSEKVLTDKLIESGVMPKAIVFVDGKPTGLMPGSVRLPAGHEKARIDIGLIQFVERPLYSFEFDSKQPSETVSITYPILSISKEGYSKFGTPLLMKKVVESKVPVEHSTRGTYKIAVPSAAYAAFVDVANTWGLATTKNVGVAHLDPKLGVQPPPWKSDHFGTTTFGEVLDQDTKLRLKRYYPAIDINWFEKSYFPYPRSQRLRLETRPPGATIFIAGVKQDHPTTHTVGVDKNYWDLITLTLKGEGECWVRSEWVKPGSTPEKPYRFCCNLTDNSRCKEPESAGHRH